MRLFANVATDAVRDMLAQLAAPCLPADYRTLMIDLGEELAAVAGKKLSQDDRIMLICSNEDADFLAKGVLQRLEQMGLTRVTLACFWNARQRVHGLDVAPIVRSYIEPGDGEDINVFIVVKSIISSGCVVRTNISELVYKHAPERILILSPVMLRGAEQNLESEFDTSIAEKFDYVWFAQDDEKKADGTVVPGVGGTVYELLGIGTSETKNSYVPQLVQERRTALASPGE